VFLSEFARNSCGNTDFVRCWLQDIGLQVHVSAFPQDFRLSKRPDAGFGRIVR
jgi:hypothetical protein